MMLAFAARRSVLTRTTARFLSHAAAAPKAARPVRKTVTKQERASLRAARKERATRVLQQQQAAEGVESTAATASTTTTTTTTTTSRMPSLQWSRWMWYLGLGVPTALIVWGFRDENSPPAKAAKFVGLTDLITGFTDELAKPSFDKLLPDWSQMPNVPHDIPVPHTLVLDLENTLVSSTWDRKYGWRHAKRPGVDKFLREMAQYYEIVLYSPSIDGIAEPVVNSLDKDGCIMHRLYRDATYYTNGVHVKDLKRLNRDIKRMVVIDDDPAEVHFNPENLIRVKPYTDPTDRTDDTLTRITPFLIEIAREGYSDIPTLLSQYQGMDADEIADEQDRRILELRSSRDRRSQQGLGAFAHRAKDNLPAPELAPASDATTSAYYGSSTTTTPQLTAKDIAGAAPPPEGSNEGLMGWMNRRAKEKEEHQMRKLEQWNEHMMKKQQKKQEEMERQQQAAS